MSFKHEIFISYRHIPPLYKSWVIEAFYEYFNEYLCAETGNANAVYIDKNNLVGEDWTKKVFPALISSKLLISFWTPNYFDIGSVSIQEFTIMKFREQKMLEKLNLSTVIPIILTDKHEFGNHTLITSEFTDWVYPPGCLKDSFNFQKEIKELVRQIKVRLDSFPSELSDDYFSEDNWLKYDPNQIRNFCSIYTKNEGKSFANEGLYV